MFTRTAGDEITAITLEVEVIRNTVGSFLLIFVAMDVPEQPVIFSRIFVIFNTEFST